MSIPTADFGGQGEELLKDVQYHNQRVLFNSGSREIHLDHEERVPRQRHDLLAFHGALPCAKTVF